MTPDKSVTARTAPLRSSLLRPLGKAAALLLLVAPFWRRSWAHQAGRLAVLAAYGYLGFLLLLLSLEDRFLYRPTPAAVGWLPPPVGVRVEDVGLTGADGTFIHAWWAAPDGWTPAQGAALYCHGNAGNLSGWGQGVARWQRCLRTGVLVIDYPGYGKSGGRPSEAGCYAAADAAYDWLTEGKRAPAGRIVLVGGSFGGAVATDVASRRPHRALILYSTFTSFPDMAQGKYPWLPARWLVRNQYDSLRKIAAGGGPVFIAHGTADALIPFAHGERLFAAAPEPKRFLARPGRTHDDEPDEAFFEAVSHFLDETVPAGK